MMKRLTAVPHTEDNPEALPTTPAAGSRERALEGALLKLLRILPFDAPGAADRSMRLTLAIGEAGILLAKTPPPPLTAPASQAAPVSPAVESKEAFAARVIREVAAPFLDPKLPFYYAPPAIIAVLLDRAKVLEKRPALPAQAEIQQEAAVPVLESEASA